MFVLFLCRNANLILVVCFLFFIRHVGLGVCIYLKLVLLLGGGNNALGMRKNLIVVIISSRFGSTWNFAWQGLLEVINVLFYCFFFIAYNFFFFFSFQLKICKGISYAAVAAHAEKCDRRKLAAMLVDHEPLSSKQVVLMIDFNLYIFLEKCVYALLFL